MSRKIKFRKTHTYGAELANIRKINPELAQQIEEKREYFESCLTTPPYRPAPGLNVEVLEGKINRPEWLKGYPKLHSFRVNKYGYLLNRLLNLFYCYFPELFLCPLELPFYLINEPFISQPIQLFPLFAQMKVLYKSGYELLG
ncbi:hypothetical protein EG832_22825 [bacterium]|nr:hypothetical protein [bacterium]